MTELDISTVVGDAGDDQADLLDIVAVCKFFGGNRPLNPATIYRGLGTRYPRPLRISANSNRWLRSECQEALQRIMNARRQSLPAPSFRKIT